MSISTLLFFLDFFTGTIQATYEGRNRNESLVSNLNDMN